MSSSEGGDEEDMEVDAAFDDDGEARLFERKRARRMTKDEALYGVFLDDDGEEEEGARGGRGRDGRKPPGPAFTKPVAFVSSGVPGSSAAAAPPPAASQREATPAVSATAGLGGASRAGLGAAATAGAAPGGAGLGFAAAAEEEEGAPPQAAAPSAFAQRMAEAAAARRREADAKAAAALAAASGFGARAAAGRGAAAPSPAGVAPAPFEAHTRGIGSKLLEKMGYKAGAGLGRSGTGITEALQTKLRPKNMGMGFNDYAEQPGAKAAAAAAAAAAAGGGGGAGARPASAAAPAPGAWKRRTKDAPQKKEYVTAEELLRRDGGGASAGGSAGGPAGAPPVTVVDMRGARGPRVVSDMAALAHAPVEADEPMPELQHNLRLVVDLAEAAIRSTDARLRSQTDTRDALAREVRRFEAEKAAHEAEAGEAGASLEHLLSACGLATSSPDSLSALRSSFGRVRASHPAAWASHGLASVAASAALPAFVSLFAAWDPLASPDYGVAELTAWMSLLAGDAANAPPPAHHFSAAPPDALPPPSDAYSLLFEAAALPRLRSAVSRSWDALRPEPLLASLDAHASTFPRPLRASLLEACVLPKLEAAVGAWDPRDGSACSAHPPHAWLHPWLPLLGHRMAPTWHPLRAKLGASLATWHPSDGSGRALLAPWRTLFGPDKWAALLSRSVLHKLGAALSSELIINPADQRMEPLSWVLSWQQDLPPGALATLLEAHFFPQWLAVLHAWLGGESPDFGEVSTWYESWKAALPDDVTSHERVRRGFTAALDLMNASLAGALPPAAPRFAPLPPPPAPRPAPPPRPRPGRLYPAVPRGGGAEESDEDGGDWADAAPPSSGAQPAAHMSLRELLARFAASHDLPFLPKPGRSHGGLPVYGFGSVSVAVDSAREALLAQGNDKSWAPASIEQLLAMHEARAKKGGRAAG